MLAAKQVSSNGNLFFDNLMMRDIWRLAYISLVGKQPSKRQWTKFWESL